MKTNVFDFGLARQKKVVEDLVLDLVNKLTTEGHFGKMFHVEQRRVVRAHDEAAGLDRIDIPAIGKVTGQRMRVSYWVKDGQVVVSSTDAEDNPADYAKAIGKRG